MEAVCIHTKKPIDPTRNIRFSYRKNVKDVRQDEKRVLDLLEAIMRPKLFVKEELRPISFKTITIKAEITKNPGVTRKSKVPKWVCRSTLANF